MDSSSSDGSFKGALGPSLDLPPGYIGADRPIDEKHAQQIQVDRILAALAAAAPTGPPHLQDYNLPDAVKTALGSWSKGGNALALIAALFAALQVAFLPMLWEQTAETANELPWKVFRWFTYASIISNVATTASAVTVLVIISDCTIIARTRALHKPNSLPARVFHGEEIPRHLLLDLGEMELLKEFGVPWQFRICVIHMLLCFFIGFTSLVVSLFIWIWQVEPMPVAAALSPLALLSCAPPVLISRYFKLEAHYVKESIKRFVLGRPKPAQRDLRDVV